MSKPNVVASDTVDTGLLAACTRWSLLVTLQVPFRSSVRGIGGRQYAWCTSNGNSDYVYVISKRACHELKQRVTRTSLFWFAVFAELRDPLSQSLWLPSSSP